MILRAASSDVPSSIAMDHDSVNCVSPPWRTDEHLLHLDNLSNCFKSQNNADTDSQRGHSSRCYPIVAGQGGDI
jgi:hypothetical protein